MPGIKHLFKEMPFDKSPKLDFDESSDSSDESDEFIFDSASDSDSDSESDNSDVEVYGLNQHLLRYIAQVFSPNNSDEDDHDDEDDDDDDENDDDDDEDEGEEWRLYEDDDDDDDDYSFDEESSEDEDEDKEPETLDTPLHIAIKKKNIEKAKDILRSGVDVDAPGEKDWTSLQLAIDVEYLPGIELLLEYGANIAANKDAESSARFWQTPIHAAVIKNRLEIVELLLTKEINVDLLSEHREAVLKYAIERRNWNVIKYLNDIRPKNDIYLNSLMRETFKNYSLDQLEDLGYSEGEIFLLLGRYAVLNMKNQEQNTILYLAIENKNIEMVKYLLKMGANINAGATYDHRNYISELSALHVAVDSELEDIVQLLLDHEGCDVNVKSSSGLTPLHIAALKNNLTIAKKLISKGATNEAYSRYGSLLNATPFHMAVLKNSVEVIKYFLHDLKISIDIRTRDGVTAIQVAAKANSLDTVKLLLDHGADFNAHSTWGDGYTALHLAVMNKNIPMIDLLLSKGPWVNIKSNDDKTILHLAVGTKNKEIVKRLLDAGAHADNVSNAGHFDDITPLLEAARLNLKEIVLMLIDKGADINATTKSSFFVEPLNAIGVVLQEHSPEMLELVLNLGADINKVRCFQTSDSMQSILVQHVTKLKAAKLFVNKRLSKWAESNQKDKKFEHKCKLQVKRMKEEKIGDSSVSYHDLLVKDVDQVTMYAENKSIEKAIKFHKLKSKFPLYTHMLMNSFNKGHERNKLLKDTEKRMQEIFVGLPSNCVRKILMYCSNDDLLMSLERNY
ncbi:putative ankyrin repeat protein RF_0381 [Microplitis demolitor]|uniref:putative ankyrin repeat protein RF_0381 n=1 Tax=Microplitis demolitor TaxID=69319 RepID=UPI0004CD607D|nr:putative ankyrin repeat protein RF_0381 [Microplitis demolitor]XP_053594140.1 putative ankyrin repeat protein RF_0381 [Microplitis demolitor]